MGKLFAVVLAIITVVSAGIIVAHVWWMPVDISTIGPRIDKMIKTCSLLRCHINRCADQR